MAQRKSFAEGVVKAMVSAQPAESDAIASEPRKPARALPGYEERHRADANASRYTKPINVYLTPAQHLALTLAAQMLAKEAPKPTQDELVRNSIAQTYSGEYETALRLLEAEE